jgi:hypothetical protein
MSWGDISHMKSRTTVRAVRRDVHQDDRLAEGMMSSYSQRDRSGAVSFGVTGYSKENDEQ